jgi:hypothetical protein
MMRLGGAGSNAEPPVEVASTSIAVACGELTAPVNVTPMRLAFVEALCDASGPTRSRPQGGPPAELTESTVGIGVEPRRGGDEPDDRWTSRAVLGANGREPAIDDGDDAEASGRRPMISEGEPGQSSGRTGPCT